jgi:hypothetical protein
MRPTKFTSALGQAVQCCAVLLPCFHCSWLILFVHCAFVLGHCWSGLYYIFGFSNSNYKWNNFM